MGGDMVNVAPIRLEDGSDKKESGNQVTKPALE
jgi:hypothetical protein